MKRTFILLFFLFFIRSISFSQYFYDDKFYDRDLLFEGGVSFGLMNGATDVGEKKGNGLSPGFYDWKSTRTNKGFYFGALYQNTVGARIEFTKGFVAAADSNSNSKWIRTRNLNYRSRIYEAALIGTFNPLPLLFPDNYPAISPYLMVGFTYFSFYPRTYYNGEWVALRRLHTEGQNTTQYPDRKEYSLTSTAFALGTGLRYEFHAHWNVRLEALYRSTGTDYLDDASKTYVDPVIYKKGMTAANAKLATILSNRYKQINPRLNLVGRARGYSGNNDKYFTINLKVGFLIGRTKIPGNIKFTE